MIVSMFGNHIYPSCIVVPFEKVMGMGLNTDPGWSFPAVQKIIAGLTLCQRPESEPLGLSDLILSMALGYFSFWPKTHPLIQNYLSFPICSLFTPLFSFLGVGQSHHNPKTDKPANSSSIARMLKHAEKSTYTQDILGSIAVLVVYSKQHQCSSIKN